MCMRSATLVLLLFFGCGPSPAQHVTSPEYDRMLHGLLSGAVPTIGVQEVFEEKDHTLLDARARDEFKVSHIAGARWVGYDDFDLARVKDLAKSTAIVVYCSVGYRSERITEKLRKAGYSNVRNLYGGIFEWVNTDHAVVDESGVTRRIHGYDREWGRWVTRGEKIY